ncbi:non-homologous end-joining DNA ligase [Amycolatopsis sp. H20-H5]|uniref:non-homologous end-joining DNA ligase n=1 Tax=Amycolatopsis sp. H20-H5 TaxID=3046309 RepID=UPI002DBA6DE2|nr:non-homologous end-joining DNA ligase [Amycolatopsis sp. H20-H5]MEC3976704.1 non-homologous end-joining DNA ligase [Amycolatopsis sp. H20-H5]
MDPDEIRTSNPDKLFYPADGLTKSDVVDHYRTVAEVMVPHLRGRPLTLRRYPHGIEGQTWFQKEASSHFPDWVRVEEIPQHHSASVRHVLCEDAATLVYLANQAVVEFHIWTSTVDALEKPDLVVIDIDPPEGVTVKELRGIARGASQVYEAIGLTPYLQATGGRGFHVVAPLDATAGHDVVRALARGAAELLVRADPDQMTVAQRKDRRGHRVFLDTNRNGYAQTFAAPYSLRARPGAGVATPLDWAELTRAKPDGWNPRKLKQRLARKEDPWLDMRAHAASATKALELLRRF